MSSPSQDQTRDSWGHPPCHGEILPSFFPLKQAVVTSGPTQWASAAHGATATEQAGPRLVELVLQWEGGDRPCAASQLHQLQKVVSTLEKISQGVLVENWTDLLIISSGKNAQRR